MSIVTRIQGKKVQHYLQGMGCQTLRVTHRKQRSVIYIDSPFPQLQEKAYNITEKVCGQLRQAWFVHVDGVLVHWHTH